MAGRRASWDISSQELGLPENITFERIGIYSRSYKSFFIVPTTSNLNMATNYVGQKMQLSSFPKNETLRPIKLTKIDDLTKLITQSQGAAHLSDE